MQSIGDSAFDGLENITDLIIPSSVTYIGDASFNYCIRLKKVKILSESIEFGGDYLFSGINNTCTIYVLNETVKQKLIDDGGVDENMTQVVTLREMNQI